MKLSEEDSKELSEILTKKQTFTKTALDYLSKDDFSESLTFIRLSSGLNLKLQDILEKYIKDDVKED